MLCTSMQAAKEHLKNSPYDLARLILIRSHARKGAYQLEAVVLRFAVCSVNTLAAQ